MNSTTVLHHLDTIAKQEGDNFDIDINKLAAELAIPVTSLVSILTELEHRDEIMIEISSTANAQEQLQYSGKVRLMETPPDEALPMV